MSVANPWRTEFWCVLVLLLCGWLVGRLSGQTALGLLLALSVYLGWHMVNIWRLVRWLTKSKKFHLPKVAGIWGAVFERVAQLQSRNRRRKKELRRLLKRFHKITMALPDATVELHPESEEIDWWNPAASRHLGLIYPRDSGQRISNLLRHPGFQEYLRSGDYEGSLQMPSPTNQHITLLVRVIPYWGGRRLVVARDMTRMQILEQARQNFIANVSHELRTPLTVVAGYIETLHDDPALQKDYGSRLHSVQVQTERMNRIVNDLLALSKLESGEVEFDDEPVPVPGLIEFIVRQARELPIGDDAGSHVFDLDIDDALCIKGRESEIYSAFSNIVFNAVRYSPAGGRICIAWRNTDSGPEFAVEDEGLGIAPQHIPRITERFYRVDAGRSRERGGTGLGLAIVKHVLLRHRARLKIESEPERGSEFRCCFPPELCLVCGGQNAF